MDNTAQKRLRRIAMVLAAVVALAAVILGVSMLPTRGGSVSEDERPGLEERDLTQRASDALRAGDATSALQLATLALQKDPEDSRARDIVTRAKRAQSPTPSDDAPSGDDSSGSGASGGGGGTSGSKKDVVVADPAALLPKEFSGFTMGSTVALDGDYSVSATARTGSSPVRTVLWAIHDAKTAQGAAAFVTKTSKVLYPKDAATVEVDGAQGYFGTDGTRYASTVYTSGRYVFEVLVSGTDEAPGGYRETAVSAAKAFAEGP